MIKLSKNSAIVFEKRYLLRDAQGHLLETPEGLFRRVARAIAGAEVRFGGKEMAGQLEEAFYQLMTSFDFLPNSPTLMNAGTRLNQLSACFVLPVDDSLKSIFSTLKNAAIIQQSGGGTGFNFSRLRPRGDFLSRTGGEASGPVSFMKVFNAATEHVKQGGRRRGANMGILNADHPDILEFIQVKRDGVSLTNFNLSVGIQDRFMQAVDQDARWELRHPGSGKPVSAIPAREIWQQILQSAWECGDPGLIFLDEINRKNPTPGLGPINATNPCGEVPLLEWEACNLGSINLSNMVTARGGKNVINWTKIRQVVKLAIRFLDNVIEINRYPGKEIRERVLGNRKIGLGVMGWAEMLIMLKIPYDNEEAVVLGRKVMQFIQKESFGASVELARTRGVFPNWEKSIYYPNIKIRNATRTSIAPTGTISMLANTSSSIEPLFALMFNRRNILDGENLLEINRLLPDILNAQYEVTSDHDTSTLEQLIGDLPEEVKRLFPTALNIPWQYHLKHQLAFQKYTDNAVSKTINLPYSATTEDISRAYRMAWQGRAKGITVYRNRSKSGQVLYSMEEEEKYLPHISDEGLGECKVCVE